MRWAIAIVALACGLAHADKAASLDHYGRGKREYAAGRFEAAIDEFDRAYREFPAPEYLHDIAQALRRLDRCPEAIAYFQRFLAAKPDAPNRAAIDAQIETLHAQCPAAAPPASPAPKPPVAAVEPDATATVIASPGPAPIASPTSPWSVSGSLGVASMSAGPVVMPPVGTLQASLRYRTGLAGELRVGAGLELAPIPYDDQGKGTLWLGGPQVSVDAALPLASRLALIGGAGLGVDLAWGLGAGNPFTMDGHASSAIALIVVRAQVGVAWRATERTRVTFLPLALQYSPARSPLAADIGSLHGLGLVGGLDVDL